MDSVHASKASTIVEEEGVAIQRSADELAEYINSLETAQDKLQKIEQELLALSQIKQQFTKNLFLDDPVHYEQLMAQVQPHFDAIEILMVSLQQRIEIEAPAVHWLRHVLIFLFGLISQVAQKSDQRIQTTLHQRVVLKQASERFTEIVEDYRRWYGSQGHPSDAYILEHALKQMLTKNTEHATILNEQHWIDGQLRWLGELNRGEYQRETFDNLHRKYREYNSCEHTVKSHSAEVAKECVAGALSVRRKLLEGQRKLIESEALNKLQDDPAAFPRIAPIQRTYLYGD